MKNIKFLTIFFLFIGFNLYAKDIILTPEEKEFIITHKTITLGSDENWSPYIIKNKNGEIIGYDTDILNRVNQITGANFRIVAGQWKDMLEKATLRDIDGLSTSAVHEKRKKFFNFSKPYVSTQRLLVVANNNPKNINSYADLKGKKIGYQAKNLFDKKLVDKIEGATIVPLNSLEEVLEQLITGKIDATVGSHAIIYLSNKKNLPYIKIADYIPNSTLNLVFSIRNDWPEAVSILNKALEAIEEDETITLHNKWFFTKKEVKKQDYKLSKIEKDYLNEKKVLKMCIDPNWMPFEKIENGKHIGISKNYIDLIQKNLPVPIELVPTKDWLESLEFGQKRKCDIFSLVMTTAERLKYLDFTKPYLDIPLVITTKVTEPFIEDITSVTNKKIGIVKGYAYGEILRDKYPDMQLVDVKNLQDGLKKVRKGELYGFIGTLIAIGYNIQQEYIGELKIAGKFEQTWSLGIGTRNDEPLLKGIFNKLISNISAEEKQIILNKWVTIKYDSKTDYELILKILAVLAIIAGIILYRQYILSKYNKELEVLSTTDALTKIYNRLKLDQILDDKVYENRRYKIPLSIILIDIDHFKDTNDQYGHDVGDIVLIELVDVLKKNIRKSDAIGRWGGEEFMIVCFDTDLNGAINIANKCRKSVEDHNFTKIGKKTISLGVAEFDSNESLDELFKRTDDLLYQAKNNGRNQVAYGKEK